MFRIIAHHRNGPRRSAQSTPPPLCRLSSEYAVRSAGL